MYHLFVFLIPALCKQEYYFFFYFFLIIFLVWVFSILVFKYLLMPLSWHFFIKFQELVSKKFMFLHFEAKLSEYLKFYISVYYICVFYFQSFAFLFFFISYWNFDLMFVKRFRKLYYYFIIIFSTLISPPDILSQILISLGVICGYELLIFLYVFKKILVR